MFTGLASSGNRFFLIGSQILIDPQARLGHYNVIMAEWVQPSVLETEVPKS
jgi:hypothetical protein